MEEQRAERPPVLDVRKIIAAACDAVAETLYPTRCVGCEDPGVLLCPSCENKLPRINLDFACARCGAPYGRLVCTECPSPGSKDHEDHVLPPPFSFDAARCACSYEGIAKRLITAYKDGDEQRLAKTIAAEIVRAVRDGDDWTAQANALVAIPATPSHLRARGWDHMEKIAQEVASLTGLPLVHALTSSKAADQRFLGRAQRAENRRNSFALSPEPEISVSHLDTILLIDDVLTTGATCNAAADVLKAAGAHRVLVATYARVW